jgi:RNA-dependent RNA polymerase
MKDLPRDPTPEKPDWSASETSGGNSEFYPSRRVLGHLYRDIKLPAVQEANREMRKERQRRIRDQQDLEDTLTKMYYTHSRHEESQITNCLRHRMINYLDLDDFDYDKEVAEHLYMLFSTYSQELSAISQMYSLAAKKWLTEEEIVGGTIVQKTSQRRKREDLTSKMRSHSSEVRKVTGVHLRIS